MAQMDERPKYVKDEDLDDTYKEDFISPVGMKLEDPEQDPEKIIETVIVKQKQAIPREDEDIQTVKRTDSDIIGSIFDRVNFIEQRITDIRENERRNIMLDISLLRREKRNEQVRFWKDMYELNAELRELMERFEVESKIVGMFEEINPKKEPEQEVTKAEKKSKK